MNSSKINKYIIILLLGLFFISSNLCAQGFQYRFVPQEIKSTYFYHKSYQKNSKDIYALSYLPKNPKRDGSKDYTEFLQKAINKNERVILPNFPIAINGNGLVIPSNRTIIFQPNSILIFKGRARGRFQDIMRIYNARNVTIINAKIIGSKNIIGQSGEWSAGICILNSSNINIENAHIKDTWGDGIFIGSENNGVSKDIVLSNIWIDNARRNGLSITSVIGVHINNVLISNTNGTAPECGVDIEPSLFGEFIQDVNFFNYYSYNNKNASFNINLSPFNSDTFQYPHSVTINVTNIFDEYSTYYIGLGFNNINKKFTPKGVVTLKNGYTKNPKHDLKIDLKSVHTNIKVYKDGLRVKN